MKKTLYKFKYGDWYEAPNYPIYSGGWSSFEDAEKHMDELKDEGWDGFSPIEEYEEEVFNSISFNPDKITRIVVAGEGGREFEKWFDKCEVSLQDDGRTIKFYTK